MVDPRYAQDECDVLIKSDKKRLEELEWLVNLFVRASDRKDKKIAKLEAELLHENDLFLTWRDRAETRQTRIAELEAENHTFRMAQKACETCDAPTMQRIAELEENNKLLRAKVEKYLKLLEELDPDPRHLAERLK